MKILVITSRYPPYHFGGYELRVKNIIDALAYRGHSVLVLTSHKESRSRGSDEETAYPVQRGLYFDLKVGSLINRMTLHRWSYPIGMLLVFIRELWRDWCDTAFIESQIVHFQPDVIYLGHIANLSKALLPYLADIKIPIIYDEGGSGLVNAWTEKGIWYKYIDEYSNSNALLIQVKRWVVNLVGVWSKARIKPRWGWPDCMQAIFNSALNYNNALAMGVPLENAKIIHSGIDTDKFAYRPREKMNSPLLLLVPSRIEPRKGQIDAVRLLSEISKMGMDARLILVGEKWSNSYYLEIEDEITNHNLEEKIAIYPMIEHNNLVNFYHHADICFFPSYYRTGFSRIPLEAMACGCVVISYGNEGSDEIIHDGQTGFLVQTEDYRRMVALLTDLLSNPRRIRQVTNTARHEVEIHHSMNYYVSRIESTILQVSEAH